MGGGVLSNCFLPTLLLPLIDTPPPPPLDLIQIAVGFWKQKTELIIPFSRSALVFLHDGDILVTFAKLDLKQATFVDLKWNFALVAKKDRRNICD